MADSRRRTNRAEGERLRSDAHDLKAPLGNIINVSQFLMEEELERADQLEFLAVIRENARTMQRVVARLLDSLRSGSEEPRLDAVPLDLAACARAALRQLSWEIRRKRVKVRVAIPARLPGLSGDMELIERVFLNLLDNAVRHSPAGGEIRVEAQGEPGGVRIEVADRGPGVPEPIARWLAPRSAAGRARAGKSPGTGLGLPFARRVAEAHGGWLRTGPRTGGGSVFSVFLPETSGGGAGSSRR